jgi:hypothetical protein
MDEQEIAAAIGWMMVACAALAMMLASLTRFGYRATTVALLLAHDYGSPDVTGNKKAHSRATEYGGEGARGKGAATPDPALSARGTMFA